MFGDERSFGNTVSEDTVLAHAEHSQGMQNRFGDVSALNPNDTETVAVRSPQQRRFPDVDDIFDRLTRETQDALRTATLSSRFQR